MKNKLAKGILLALLCAGVALCGSCSNSSDDSSDGTPVETVADTYTGDFTVAGTSYSRIAVSDGSYTMTGNGTEDSGTYELSRFVLEAGTYIFRSRVHNGIFIVTIGNGTITLASGTGSDALSAGGSGTRLVVFSGDNSSSPGSGSGGSVETRWITVSAGTFQMGCELDATPVHSVTLTKGFEMCDHEVTRGEWKAVMGNIDTWTTYIDEDAHRNLPIDGVTWYAAIIYCNKLSLREGRTPCYAVSGITDWAALPSDTVPTTGSRAAWDAVTCDWDANGYRLPTEAEWEYAARAGNTTTDAKVWSGTTEEGSLGNYAWYDGNYEYHTRHDVKTKLPNALGLYDMTGNVIELCWDWYDRYPSDAVSDPRGASSGSSRVLRGGSDSTMAEYCTVSRRSDERPYGNSFGYLPDSGFRVVRSSSGT